MTANYRWNGDCWLFPFLLEVDVDSPVCERESGTWSLVKLYKPSSSSSSSLMMSSSSLGFMDPRLSNMLDRNLDGLDLPKNDWKQTNLQRLKTKRAVLRTVQTQWAFHNGHRCLPTWVTHIACRRLSIWCSSDNQLKVSEYQLAH